MEAALARSNDGAASGNRTPDLRITSRKRVVHQVLAPRGRARGCVQASMIAQSVGCSLGCSHSQLGMPVNPLVRRCFPRA